MEQTPFTQQERIESLKAGLFSASAASLVFIFVLAANQFIFLPLLPSGWVTPVLTTAISQALIAAGRSMGLAAASGFLFGVTYRYVIRRDANSQLQSGAVLAFSFVRGLAQIDTGVGSTGTTIPFVLMAIESWLMFSCDRIVLNQALDWGWVKPFATPTPTSCTSKSH